VIMKAMCVALCLSAAPGWAGGLGEVPPWTDPCADPPSETAYKASVFGMDADEAWQMHLVLWEARCGGAEPLPLYKQMGMTDEELLRAVFNGHEVPPVVAPVPLPSGGLMMLGALCCLGLLKGRVRWA